MDYLTTFGASGYTLRDLQLFDQVNQEQISPMLADCPVVRVAAGQSVVQANSPGTRLFIILRGALSVDPDTREGLADGRTSKIVQGESVGELSVLDQHANSSHVSALEESDLLVIDTNRLWRLIDESNGVARNLLRLLAFRVRAADAHLRRRQRVGEFYRQLSMVDGLTCLQNRSWLNDHLPLLIANAHTANNPLSIVMIDLDHFKRFNDSHGHLAGDNALQVAANILIDSLRPRDFAARYGGEELMVILPGTHLQGADTVAQRLCERMQQAVVFPDMRQALPHITGSFGIACLTAGQDAFALIANADAALYRAKEAGRNRVSI